MPQEEGEEEEEEEEETSTTFILSPISSLEQEEDVGEVVSSTPAFDWDWEEKVLVLAEDEEVNATDFESENITNASDIDIANVSIKAAVIDSAENTIILITNNSETGSAESEKAEMGGTVEKEESDQTDEEEELLLLRIDSTETSDNRSVGTNLTNNQTEGGILEESVDAAEDSFLEDLDTETDGVGGDLFKDLEENIESVGSSPFDAMFSPQRNRARGLACSLLSTFCALLLLCPFL